MLKLKRRTRLMGLALAGALALVVANTIAARTASAAPGSPQHADHTPSPEAKKQDQAAGMMGQSMMALRQKMMADNQTADAQLQPLIDKMNAATGGAKTEAMAAVLTELVRQRTIARGQMDQMSQMMPNMMGMMMQGMTAEMHAMSAHCPMMKESGGTPPK